MSIDTPRAGKVRPGGRTQEVAHTVATSVLKLITKGNIDFSYSELADLSGVHKTTLYRRWPQRIDLVRAAIKVHNQSFQLKTGKNWDENAEAIVRSLAMFLSQPAEIAINCALFAQADAASNLATIEYWEPIQDALNELVLAAQSRGEIPACIDPATLIATLSAPVILNTVMTRSPAKKELINNLIRIARCYGINT